MLVATTPQDFEGFVAWSGCARERRFVIIRSNPFHKMGENEQRPSVTPFVTLPLPVLNGTKDRLKPFLGLW